ncbi:carbon-nitrogen hydrolase family protein [Gordonia sp. X0973]|uniref:carbon-nitrogen hydrolase family protein n=1 Tax=Gordonia sp. X0973 TaxID=2742602 RepID=UPI000F536B86|nr:carbon-nitrogen hydrolase family protein [Gordonia sp. X0973]QKT06194.1 carbon-nitrogen hydrolase family protein [Gordonia sp. X0973]
MRVAIAQISAGTDPAANLGLVADQIATAADGGADLVVFPEASMCRFGVPLRDRAEPVDGPWATGVRAAARAHGIAVVVGMFTPGADGRVRNTALVVDRTGAVRTYDKMHCYDAFGYTESDTVEPGTHPVLLDLPLADGTTARLGVAICYDIRFPELFGALADAGAQVIAVPTSWGVGPGKAEQWRILTSARALDSGAFLVAADQAAPADPAARKGPAGIGISRLIDPFGSVVDDEYTESPQLRVHRIDLADVTRARDTLGMRSNRRPIGAVDLGGDRRTPAEG